MMTRYGGVMTNSGLPGSMTADAGDSRPSPRPSLRDDSRSHARSRIVQGAMVAVAKWGLDATVDQIASESGVSRRTVFRQFSSHAELLLVTLEEIRQLFDAGVPKAPSTDEDLEAWLIESTVSIHEIFRSKLGRAFWDLHVDRPRISQDVTDFIAKTPQIRHRIASTALNDAWRALDAPGEPPSWLLDTFSIHLSGFATFAHAYRTPRETGELSAKILWITLNQAVRDARAATTN
jgi:AcrR family transcriptional regulator